MKTETLLNDGVPLRNALSALAGALSAFRRALETESHPTIWVRALPESSVAGKNAAPNLVAASGEGDDPVTARQRAIEAVLSVTYTEGQDTKVSRRWVGVVPIGPSTMARARELNEAKARVAAEMRQFRGTGSKRPQQRLFNDTVQMLADSAEIRRVLGSFGRGRLHLVQATRKLPLVDRVPAYIGFCWSSASKHIKIVSPDDAVRLAGRVVDGATYEELEAFREVRANQAIRVIEGVKAHMRANLRFDDDQAPERLCLMASLPIFYLVPPGGAPIPSITRPPDLPPDESKPRTRKVRNDAIDTSTAPLPKAPHIRIGPARRKGAREPHNSG